MTLEDELKIMTDFLAEVADHGFADRNDVFEACRDAVERLGLTDIYQSFRATFDSNTTYEANGEGGIRRVASL